MRSFCFQLYAAVSFAVDYTRQDWNEGSCKHGKQQSPIDINMVTKNANLDLYLNQGYDYYNPDSGRTMEIDGDDTFLL